MKKKKCGHYESATCQDLCHHPEGEKNNVGFKKTVVRDPEMTSQHLSDPSGQRGREACVGTVTVYISEMLFRAVTILFL